MLQKMRKVLVIDSNLSYRKLIKENLASIEDVNFDLFETSFLFEGERIIQNNQIAIVILDLNLPDGTGLNVYNYLHDKHPHLTYIILCDTDNQRIAKEAMNRGAHASIVKSDLDNKILERTIRFAVLRHAYRERERIRKKIL